MCDSALLNLATSAAASKSLNYSVSNLFKALNLLRIRPSIWTESCDTSITI